MGKNSVKITVDDRQLQKAFKQLPRQLQRDVDKAVESSAITFLDLLKNDILNQKGSGKQIIVKQKAGAAGSPHKPSVEGEPPSPITSVYRSSWQRSKVRSALQRVATADRRGPWLEYGTRTMGERPHVRPAVQQHESTHVKMVTQAIQKLRP